MVAARQAIAGVVVELIVVVVDVGHAAAAAVAVIAWMTEIGVICSIVVVFVGVSSR